MTDPLHLPAPTRRPWPQHSVDFDGLPQPVELPFVTVVLADLSVHRDADTPPLADRPLVEIDIERFDDVMRAIAPSLELNLAGTQTGGVDRPLSLAFQTMSDFEPASLARQVPGVHNGHEGNDARDAQLAHILADAGFRRLEASWRALHRLVQRSEPDDQVRIRVLDLSRDELHKSLRRFRGISWDQSPVFKRLYGDGIGSLSGEPVSCVVLDFAFDHGAMDCMMLGEMAKIGVACQALVLADAAPTLMRMDSWHELRNPRDLNKIFTTPDYAAWRALRQSDDARYLVLTLPRRATRAPWPSLAADRGASMAGAAMLLAEAMHAAVRLDGLGGQLARLGAVVDGIALQPSPVLAGPAAPLATGVDVPMEDRRAGELDRAGLVPLQACAEAGQARCTALPTLHQPAEYDDPEATQRAQRAARLPYVLVSSRLMHHLRRIMRNRLQVADDPEQARVAIQRWLSALVDPDPRHPGAFDRPPNPLRAAEVQIERNDHGGWSVTLQVDLAD